MGFDLIGVNPSNKRGEYFRNNIWWWRRLWDFCCFVAHLSEDTYRSGHCNNGHSIIGEERIRLKNVLKNALEDRGVYAGWIIESEQAYQREENGEVVCHYPFSWENVAEFYDFIDNNEGFEIW